LRENPEQLLPEKYILRIFAMICIPLYFIHKNKIVHRDLKPDNILQKRIGDKEIFLITDFGTSKNTESQSDEEEKKGNSQQPDEKSTLNFMMSAHYASSE
jgi:serine/threonine protein kinase